MSTPQSNKIREEFAHRLRMLRKQAGFKTARLFAATLEIDENRYTRYERAEVEPDLGLLARFCQVLGISPNRLLGFEDFGSSGSFGPDEAIGFAESEQSHFETACSQPPQRAGSNDAQAQADRVRMAAWQLADARARLGEVAEPNDAVQHLRATAEHFDEILKDPLAYVSHMARQPEIDRASREKQEAVMKSVEKLLQALSSATS